MMKGRMPRQTRMTILLSLNAVAILVAGVLIAGAINSNGAANIVAERSDENNERVEEVGLLDPALQSLGGVASNANVGSPGSQNNNTNPDPTTANHLGGNDSGGNVPNGELWTIDSLTIYQTADRDICIDDSLPGYDNMYWQTSNTEVIASFYAEARAYLGYSSNKCRFPKIVGTGTTVITAGTYDGSRRDTLTVTVIATPAEQWKRDVLDLVNTEREKAGIGTITWGATCENAANVRATEIKSTYAHLRPDGTQWHTACPIPPSGGKSGENLAAGASVPSPEAVVVAWMNSPEHRKNILDPDFKYLSVGFQYDANSQYKVYWSQIFTTY